MANRRISMGKIRELLCFHEECGLSNRQIARDLNIFRTIVGQYHASLKISDLTMQRIKLW